MDELELKLPEAESESIRTRCSMIIHSLESALGDYVLEEANTVADLPEEEAEKLLAKRRANEDGEGGISESALSAVVEESYLDDILTIARKISKGTSKEDHLNELDNVIDSLGIFSVRNACDHSNRRFPLNFWFRACTLATHGVIDKLKFDRVKEAFEASTEGRLQRPPGDWPNDTRWFVTNNLPSPFDHDVTGLVGRREKIGRLEEVIKKPRVKNVAVSATGGLGKTALVLEFLRNIALKSDSHKWLDRIIYVSAKTERLTKSGVKKIEDPNDSIQDAKQKIVKELKRGDESEEEIFERWGDKRIIVCIDNLETILVDTRDKEEAQKRFQDFRLDLPEKWKLLITSRVSVEGSSFTISLDPLSRQDGIILARKYLRSKGMEGVDQEVVSRIVDSADKNPLAIRLIIDSIYAGTSLEKAIEKTKKDVVNFSYKNLVNHLPKVSQEILECLFVAQEPLRRFTTARLLERNTDEVADGFSKLLGTSLCTRVSSEEGEKYELSASVRELLLRTPVDLDTRQEVEERQRAFKETEKYHEYKKKTGTTPLSVFHVSDGVPAPVRPILQKGFKAIKSDPTGDRERLVEVMNDIESAARDNSDCSELNRTAGVLRLKLNDSSRGISRLREAALGNSFDPAAAFELAKKYFKDRQHDELKEISSLLIERGWDEPGKSNRNQARRVVELYYLPRLWTGEAKNVYEELQDWNEKDTLKYTYGSFYVESILSIYHLEDYDEDEKIVEAFKTIKKIIDESGYGKSVVITSMNLIEETASLLRTSRLNKDIADIAADFVAENIDLICQSHNKYSLEESGVRGWVRVISDSSSESNKLKNEDRWKSYIENESGGIHNDDEFYFRGTIKNKVRGFSFVWGKGGVEYFMHKSNINCDWDKVSEGDTIRVLEVEENEENDKKPEISMAQYIE